MHVRTPVLAFLLTLQAAAWAQPERFGCHYFRNKGGAPVPPSAADRALIDETIARSDTFDILHYEIRIDVTDYAGAVIKASTTVTFTPLMAGQDFIRFDLYQLTVDSVTTPSGTLAFAYDGQFLRVDFDSAPALGDTLEITVHYRGTPHRDPQWGGFYFESQYIYNLGIGLTSIPPNFGKVWYPCFDSFVERATYTYHVISSGTYRAHCQGDFLGETTLGGDTVIRSFALNQPIPTHLSAIAVAAYQDHDYVHTGANGPIPVRLTAKAPQLSAMIAKMVDVGAAIDAGEFWYGPYIWGRVGYVLTTDGALEIPTNIAYPQFMTGQTIQNNRGLLAHELGHHWWGDAVTPFVHNDMWLKEGPAEYTDHLVEEWIGGRPALVKAVKDNQLYVLRQAHVQDGGFQPLSPMPDPYIYGLHTYYKGASVMHNMRGYLGDSLFRVAMSGIQADLVNSTITPEQFRDAIEAQTGVDMDPFFNAWVFEPGFAAFEVYDMNSQPVGGQWNVDLDIRQKLRGTSVYHEQVPVDLTLIGADRQRAEYTITASGEFTTLAVQAPFQPVMAVLNGHTRLNQNRLDHEFMIAPGTGFSSVLPWVDFRLYPVTITDSTLFRVDHIWSGPDTDQVGWGIDQISSVHYWNVDGIWPAGTVLKGRVYYSAVAPSDLDHDLFDLTEQDATLVYRERPTDPWTIAPDITVTTGPLTNGSGYIDIDVLRKGQYAFAKGTGIVSVAEHSGMGDLQVFPIPAAQAVTVRGTAVAGQLFLRVVASDGRTIHREAFAAGGAWERVVDVSAWAPGLYVLQVHNADGLPIGQRRVEVVR